MLRGGDISLKEPQPSPNKSHLHFITNLGKKAKRKIKEEERGGGGGRRKKETCIVMNQTTDLHLEDQTYALTILAMDFQVLKKKKKKKKKKYTQ